MRALLAAADSEATGEFNVGTSIETSILDLVEELAVIAGKADFIPEMQPARAGEIDRMALDPSRIIEHLGWRPETASPA